MASPADFAQTSRLRHVTSIRTSGDHGYMVGPELLWAWFLHTNVMARALGLWPYKDVFHSAPGSATREVEALLAALSAGPGRHRRPDRRGRRRPDPADVPRRRRARAARRAGRRDRSRRVRRAGVVGRAARRAARTRSTRPVAGATWSRATSAPTSSRTRRGSRWPISARTGPDTDSVAVFDWRTRRVDVLPADGAYDVALEPARLGLPRARAGAPGRGRGDRRSARCTRARATPAIADVAVDADGDG